jgi:hypothetical protein
MRPWLVRWEVRTVVEANVDGVEGDDEILSAVHFLEYFDYTRFRADLPNEILVRCSVIENHAFFIDDGEIGSFDGTGIVAVVSEVAVLS